MRYPTAMKRDERLAGTVTPAPEPYGIHTSRFELRPVRPVARPCRAPPPFVTLALLVTPAKAGVHPWLPMLPQPVESRANRLRLPRKPRLGPGSGAGATNADLARNAVQSERLPI